VELKVRRARRRVVRRRLQIRRKLILDSRQRLFQHPLNRIRVQPTPTDAEPTRAHDACERHHPNRRRGERHQHHSRRPRSRRRRRRRRRRANANRRVTITITITTRGAVRRSRVRRHVCAPRLDAPTDRQTVLASARARARARDIDTSQATAPVYYVLAFTRIFIVFRSAVFQENSYRSRSDARAGSDRQTGARASVNTRRARVVIFRVDE